MIEELRIENLGVIAAAQLQLGPGLTVITGETGAGKTMVLTGLHLLLGGVADAEAVRPGAERIVIEGTVVPPPDSAAVARALEAGAELDDGALIVARVVPAEGRSRAYLGGRSVPQRLLGEIGTELVTVHGQSDQLRLRGAAHQRAALDQFAGAAHGATIQRYRQVWADLQEARRRLERWQADEGERAARIAALREGLEAVEALDPVAGEDAALRAEAERLGNVEELRRAAGAAHTALSGGTEPEGTDAVALLDHARRALGATTVDPELAGYADRLAEIGFLVADIGSDLARYLDELDSDPRRLETVHARRADLGALAARLGIDADGLLDWSRQAAIELATLDDPASGAHALAERVAELEQQLVELAERMSEGRTTAARAFEAAVSAELAALAMPAARLEVSLTATDGPGPWGAETVSLLLRPHPDAPARPLGTGASGGELSRVMLALEVSLAAAAEASSAHTFVFDEVDAGVGGRAALEVGRRLAQLARRSQVIVVTHLAQVAAFADAHLVVAKEQRGERTLTGIRRIAEAERERELARMLSGQEDSEVARRHAAELRAAATVAR